MSFRQMKYLCCHLKVFEFGLYRGQHTTTLKTVGCSAILYLKHGPSKTPQRCCCYSPLSGAATSGTGRLTSLCFYRINLKTQKRNSSLLVVVVKLCLWFNSMKLFRRQEQKNAYGPHVRTHVSIYLKRYHQYFDVFYGYMTIRPMQEVH